MSIKLGDRFEIKRDKYQWVLTEFITGVNSKTKAPTINGHTSYYATLGQVASELVNRGSDQAQTVRELQAYYEAAVATITELLKEVK